MWLDEAVLHSAARVAVFLLSFSFFFESGCCFEPHIHRGEKRF